MTSTEAFALWDASDRFETPYPCTQQADDPCRFIDTDEHSWGKCKACGFVSHDIPGNGDDAHAELCCGSIACTAKDAGLCITHDRYPE